MADTSSAEGEGFVEGVETPHANGRASLTTRFGVAPVRSVVRRLGDVPVPGLPARSRPPLHERRSTARDGLGNQLEWLITTRGGPVWDVVQAIPPARSLVNKALTNRAILTFPTRPNPFSTMADYTSWASLTDRTFSSRHLPAAVEEIPDLPAIEALEAVFTREAFVESPKSTVLFSYFAQWFTDGFLRSDRAIPPDLRRNESSHDIDLTNLYGLHPDVALQLRTLEGGRLKSQMINGEEYPPYLCENGTPKPEFSLISVLRFDHQTVEARNRFFAMGSDTSNLQIGFVMCNVLFLREHNRIAAELADAYPLWDDERLFATTRAVLTVMLMKLVIEEYINHITPTIFKIEFSPGSFLNERWYRQNWMAVEFNLLYRWHSLVPSSYRIGGEHIPIMDTLFNTKTVTDNGLGALFADASEQPAGQIGLGNTPPELWDVEALSIANGRAVGLRPYNDYRELAGFPRVTEFDQITSNVRVREALRELYRDVDNIEFYVGLWAEEVPTNGVVPGLVGRMVALDAFSQVYTNPLLSPRIFNAETFSPKGMEIIRSTKSLSQIVHRNVPEHPGGYFVSLTRKGWKRA